MFHNRKAPGSSRHSEPAETKATAASMLRKRGHTARAVAPVQAKTSEQGERLAANDLGYTHADREYRELFLGTLNLKKARGEALVACLVIGYAVFRMLETRMAGAAADGSTAVEVAIGIGAAILGLAIYHCSAAKHRP